MAALKDFADLANNFSNKILNFPLKFSQNAAPVAKVDTVSSQTLSKLKLAWLFNHAPGFCLRGKQVKILNEPRSFYDTLKEQIQKANSRIVLASLYLGTGRLEKQLVLQLKNKLDSDSNIGVKILIDCTRGSRGEINSRQILTPLLNNNYKSCQVALYQTPYLQGMFYQFLPLKYKEIVGLQHIKIYLFDNNVILTGANLSNDYFTNRQDRYIMISDCKELCDFMEGLVDKISEFSFRLNAENKLKLSRTWNYDPMKTAPFVFNSAASASIKNYYESYRKSTVNNELSDTIIFPLLEMGPFNIHTDSEVTSYILKKCGSEDLVYLTTGYFNLTQLYMKMIIEKSKAHYKILMAHPEANGFYKAKGLAGGIPYAYTHLAMKFLQEVEKKKQKHRINILEFKRPGWTYHAKGLWLSSLQNQLPFLTMIGSPNFEITSVSEKLQQYTLCWLLRRVKKLERLTLLDDILDVQLAASSLSEATESSFCIHLLKMLLAEYGGNVLHNETEELIIIDCKLSQPLPTVTSRLYWLLPQVDKHRLCLSTDDAFSRCERRNVWDVLIKSGERSLNHDLECQFLLVTMDENLRKELLQEREALFEPCQPFTEDVTRDPTRQTPLWVQIVAYLFKTYL